jgi:hypothetical protein
VFIHDSNSKGRSMPASSLVYSVIAPASLARLVASSYGVGKPSLCRLFSVGVTHTYEVRAGRANRRCVFIAAAGAATPGSPMSWRR